jgi:hypothetical protein
LKRRIIKKTWETFEKKGMRRNVCGISAVWE